VRERGSAAADGKNHPSGLTARQSLEIGERGVNQGR
jgi:hypothetical protein